MQKQHSRKYKYKFFVWYKLGEQSGQIDLFPSEEIGPMHWAGDDSEHALAMLEKSIGSRYNKDVFPRVGKKWQ